MSCMIKNISFKHMINKTEQFDFIRKWAIYFDIIIDYDEIAEYDVSCL